MTYVVLLGDQVVAGPFATAAEAVKAREALIKAKFRHINGSRRPILRVSRVLFLWSASVINFITPVAMTAQITSLLDLKKELQNNFAELKIDFFPSERRPEWIEVGKEAWGETTIHINLHSDCISIFGIVRGKSDSYAARPLPAEAQDCLKQIRTLLEPLNLIVVHGPVTVGWFES
jgi:hypothetical protein